MSLLQYPGPDSNLLEPASEIAREAGALLMSHFNKVAIEYKGEVDLVTEADRASERLIVKRIQSRWPDHAIMGEEGTRTNAGSDFQWYIDPLDGTTNFAHGFPVFCVSIGLAYKGELVLGVIYDPTRDELFAAEKGSGARLNGRAIHVSRVQDLGQTILATGFPSQKRHKNPNIYFYHQLTLKTHGIRRAGSAAIDLAYTACGRFDGYWEFNLNPWDVAAGVVLVQEAGGIVTDMFGGPFQIQAKEVLAANPMLHKQLMAEMQAIFAGEGLEALASPVEYSKRREL